MEMGLKEALRRLRPSLPKTALAPHRIPLGLILLSRQQLTADQLRTALAAQRDAAAHASAADAGSDTRKIGAWLQQLGFVTEQQITAALARQWSCPVLRSTPTAIAVNRLPSIPSLLLESFHMIPVEVVESTRTLLMAFSERIDFTVLYAIEQMLGYHTEACLVCPSTLQKSLHSLERRREATDVIFDCVQDVAECARIIGNYSAKVRAIEVRIAGCGDHLWVRLERLRQEAVTLVLRTSANSQLSIEHLRA